MENPPSPWPPPGLQSTATLPTPGLGAGPGPPCVRGDPDRHGAECSSQPEPEPGFKVRVSPAEEESRYSHRSSPPPPARENIHHDSAKCRLVLNLQSTGRLAGASVRTKQQYLYREALSAPIQPYKSTASMNNRTSCVIMLVRMYHACTALHCCGCERLESYSI